MNSRHYGTLVAIDPGVGGTGIAVFIEGVFSHSMLVKPDRKDPSFENRAQCVAGGVLELLRELGPVSHLVVENPELQEGSRKGLAAKNSGGLLKLTLLTGMIIGAVASEFRTMTLVTPSAWKGQLPKDVSFSRVARAIGDPAKVEVLKKDRGLHMADAVGIGLWALGEF